MPGRSQGNMQNGQSTPGYPVQATQASAIDWGGDNGNAPMEQEETTAQQPQPQLRLTLVRKQANEEDGVHAAVTPPSRAVLPMGAVDLGQLRAPFAPGRGAHPDAPVSAPQQEDGEQQHEHQHADTDSECGFPS